MLNKSLFMWIPEATGLPGVDKGGINIAPIDQDLLDEIAELEVKALLEGLKDQELRSNPAFLEKVRKFLAQNKYQTTPETPGMAGIKKETMKIPIFEDIN